MPRLLGTFRRHKLAVVAPLIVCLAVSAGVVLSQPRTYEASAKVWVGKNGLDTRLVTYVNQSDAQSAVLLELLKSRSFDLSVAAESGLTQDLARRAQASSGQISLSQLLSGKLASSRGPLSNEQLNDLIYTTLTHDATIDVVGPDIVSIAFVYEDPVMSARTVQAIYDQYTKELLDTQLSGAKTEVDFYTTQLASANADLEAADARVTQYLDSHPTQRAPDAIPDAALISLKEEDDAARSRRDQLQVQLDSAQLQAAMAKDATPSGVRLIDRPAPPSQPLSRTKPLLFDLGAGVAAGLVLSFLLLAALSLADTAPHQPAEVEALGLRVVAVIPEAS